MQELIIISDILSKPDQWERVSTFDIRKALTDRFDTYPDHARIYHGNVSKDTDVTPKCEEDVEALAKMPGPFYFVQYPGDIVFWAAVIFAVTTVVLLLQKPKLPTSLGRNTSAGSSNNELSDRVNKPRIGGRIPDIYGTVTSVPDLLSLPYSVFKNHIEVEHTFMCIGRGHYEFPLVDGVMRIRDGDTLVSKIEGASLAIYNPGLSPNNGDTPTVQVGDPINEKVVTARRSKAVNGQVLLAPNDAGDDRIVGISNIRFGPSVHIQANPASDIDFTTVFATGNDLTLTAPGIYFEPGSTGTGLDSYTWNYSSSANGGTIRFFSDGTIQFRDGAAIVFAPGSPISVAFTISTSLITKDSISINLSGHYRYTSNAVVSADPPIHELILTNPELSNADWTQIASMTGGFVDVTANVVMTQGGEAYLSGEYVVDTVSAKDLTLVNRYSVTDYWAWIASPTAYLSPTLEGITATSTNWVGPFVLDVSDMNEVIANYIALQGLWKDDGTTQTAFNIDVQLGVTRCDAAGTPLGPETFYNVTINGSANVKSARAATLRTLLGFTGRVSVRSRRLTPKDTAFVGTIADEVKWRDIYSVSPVSTYQFQGITTVQCLTQATQGALAVADRKINILVQRKLPLHIGAGSFGALTPTNDAADAIFHICTDPYLGNRPTSEINFDQIDSVMADVRTYFNLTTASDFCYTFDNDNTSFEEMLATVANAVFCVAYRQGSVINLFFEKEALTSTLLFNHRNKVPRSEKRTHTFGADFDGIDYEYVDPLDDAKIVYRIPTNGSAIRPKKVESIGVRNFQQAYLHAWREYNRLLYQRISLEFDATEEADILINNQRILVADNTRADVQDGYVVSQDGLVLTLSQPVYYASGVIFLQHVNATVEAINFTGGDGYNITLSTAPSFVLSLGDDKAAQATYMIVRDTDEGNARAYLALTKDQNDNFTSRISAVNYDARYYANDKDFV